VANLKLAIIGCGRISYKHVEAIISNSSDVELTAVCDIKKVNAEKRADEYVAGLEGATRPKVFSDYKDMFNQCALDIVAIATESGYHADIAIECMNAKKHVIVEKPIALSTEDADRMIEFAKANNVKLCVCHQNRFNTPIQMLKQAVEENRFGRLINGTARILWTRDMNYYKQAPWRGTWSLDGGTLMNQCIHNIDLLQWIIGGEIDTVYSQTGNFIRDIEAEDFGAMMIRFKNGAIGLIEGSACVFPKNLEETLSIFGENGTVCIGGLAVNRIETWQFIENYSNEAAISSQYTEDPDSVYGKGHTPLYQDMIYAIKNDRKPLIDGEEGKKAMKIILAAYKSQKTGLPIKYDSLTFATTDMTNQDIRK
jgi:predicted dehydrogenase